MRKLIIFTLAVIGLLAGQGLANVTIFSDSFDSENGGVGVLNYTGFANWTVSGGTVDLIGNGYFDFLPGNGLYVDMDGSTGNAGLMTSSISLQPGTYILSFELAGNHRNGSTEQVDVQVDLGSVFSGSYSLGQSDPFMLITENFTVNSAMTVALTFEGIGGDNIGMLLDDVSISLIPAPGALLLGSMGMGIVGWLRRRKAL